LFQICAALPKGLDMPIYETDFFGNHCWYARRENSKIHVSIASNTWY